ncbi:type V CRISPR-associated protein Cas12k [Leptolyngbya boryana CZ1]|uniref:Type V CRISPR-associated protein Cas12k n=1 Tax=Leptolyngbya boryana CZ1 TaxID=3060204 RepID=A0AA97ASA7_LEPBY|nr:type V CRISPR-associated protein Cas12k [Leptolyngbya boryana]WNZ47364.1 type V CRISPR-associated protein Cas12k [Leptolyngbya boryana CZ1]
MGSHRTIECLLVPSEWIPPTKKNPDSIAIASEDAKQLIWKLCVTSTQLCRALNDYIIQHPEFETWKTNRDIPDTTLKSLWNLARSNPPYAEMPERFNRSAQLRIQSIYAGWFKVQEKLLLKLNGLNRWLSIAKSDQELVESSGYSLERIRSRAEELIYQVKARLEASEQIAESNSGDEEKHPESSTQATSTITQSLADSSKNKSGQSLRNELFSIYFSLDTAEPNHLDRCAIIHLLKNNCEVAKKPENLSKFTSGLHAKRKKVQRTEKQLESQFPQLRDLGDEALKALTDVAQRVAQDNIEFAEQLANLQRSSNPLPYPVLFYSSDDLGWYLIKRKHPTTQVVEERIFVKFKGLNNYLKTQLQELGLKKNELRREYIFEVCCDRRQHQIFRQFLKDWQTYSSDPKKFSISLFLLQSAALQWRKTIRNGTSEYQPYLQCTIDSRCLTAEGTELVKAEEIAKVKRRLEAYEIKQQNGEELTDAQQEGLKRSQSQLNYLNNSFPRASKPPYKGNLNLIVGVSFNSESLVTVAVVDCSTCRVLAYRSIRQLLGKDYELLSAYRLEQGRNANERHKQQKRGKISNLSESNKGKHIDRLLAKAIVELVQEFKAASLALPNLTGLQESIQSAIAAKAELRYPGDKAKQDEYKKQYKINVHRWSYSRLIRSLKDRADKIGVPIENGQQPFEGDLKYQAMQVGLSAYHAR